MNTVTQGPARDHVKFAGCMWALAVLLHPSFSIASLPVRQCHWR